jgi:hypothetical protein
VENGKIWEKMQTKFIAIKILDERAILSTKTIKWSISSPDSSLSKVILNFRLVYARKLKKLLKTRNGPSICDSPNFFRILNFSKGRNVALKI